MNIEETSLDLYFNQIRPLTYSVSPANAKIEWKSSDTSVATVTNGRIKALGAGTATIEATSGSFKDSCTINVIKEEIGTVRSWDFEDDNVFPWSVRWETEQATEDCIIDADEGFNGSKCVRMIGREDGRDVHGILLDMTNIVEPSATYRIKTKVKLAKDTPGVDTPDTAAIVLSTQTQAIEEVEATHSNKYCITKVESNFNVDAPYNETDPTEWTEVDIEMSTPDDVYDFGIYFETGNAANVDIMVDDTSLTLVSRNEPQYDITPLKTAFKDIFPYIGFATVYNEIMGENTSGFVNNMVNSFTMGNEMKPDGVIPKDSSVTTMLTIAEAKKLGYYIPDNYGDMDQNRALINMMVTEEPMVPKLNFDRIDVILKRADEMGIRMRYHTLFWHEQTPALFFKANFRAGVGTQNVTAETMDTRMEFFAKTVLKHILDSGYGHVLYSIDVMNEYLNSWGSSRTNESGRFPSFYENIYQVREGDPTCSKPANPRGKMIIEAEFVKKSFKYCYDILKEYNRTDISLIYNDFNEYNGDMPEQMIELYNYVNKQDAINVNGEKLCTGIGMQSHMSYLNPAVSTYQSAVDKFTAVAGMEIHVTELDITHNKRDGGSATEEECAAYYKDIMNVLINANQQNPSKPIKSVTIWGLYDAVSWRADRNPLIFKGLYNPKLAYYSIIDAATSK